MTKTQAIIIALISFCILEVHSKKVHTSLHHKHGFYHEYSLIALLVALKVKAVLVMLAVWGGAVLTAKVFIALLLPLISSYGHKFYGHHHHEFDHSPPYFPKHADFETYEGPDPPPPVEYNYKRWNRRTQKRNETSLSGYR